MAQIAVTLNELDGYFCYKWQNVLCGTYSQLLVLVLITEISLMTRQPRQCMKAKSLGRGDVW